MRAEFEQTPDALAARELLFQGEQLQNELKIPAAKKKYLEGFYRWRAVLDAFPALVADSTTGDELLEAIKKYRKLLDQDTERLGDDFPLWDILEEHDIGDFREELERWRNGQGSSRDDGAEGEGDSANRSAEAEHRGDAER
jgi:hypothetical protein